MNNNYNNDSSSFIYSVDLVYSNMNNINKDDDLITNDCINNKSKNASDDNNNHNENENDDSNNDKKMSVILTLSLKWNKILPKGVKRNQPKIIINFVTIIAVKKRRAIQNLSPKLMILSVRTLKRQMPKRQYSY